MLDHHAIYYTPGPDHPRTVAAIGLGTTPEGRSPVASAALDAATTKQNSPCSYHCARRYGFHATLKPPFRLKEGYSVEELERALRAFVTAWPSCPIGPLKLDLLGASLGSFP